MGRHRHPGVRLQGVRCSDTRTGRQQRAQLWELCAGRGTPLLSAKLREELRSLRSIRECERDTEQWSRTRPSPSHAQQVDRAHGREDSLASLCTAVRSDSRDRGQWQHVSGLCCEKNLSIHAIATDTANPCAATISMSFLSPLAVERWHSSVSTGRSISH